MAGPEIPIPIHSWTNIQPRYLWAVPSSHSSLYPIVNPLGAAHSCLLSCITVLLENPVVWKSSLWLALVPGPAPSLRVVICYLPLEAVSVIPNDNLLWLLPFSFCHPGQPWEPSLASASLRLALLRYNSPGTGYSESGHCQELKYHFGQKIWTSGVCLPPCWKSKVIKPLGHLY